jgi:crossover junction endodeoxyribonuclease RuvC
MIILGVDPGTLITGYGVIEASRGTIRLIEYNVVRSRSDRSMPLRLKAIYSNLCDVIERHHPDEFAIETAFYGKNAQSALKIGHARGVSILAAVNYKIPTTEYSPREVKKSVVGNGASSKQQVLYMVRTLLKLRETPRFYDATDALAVAICHYLRYSSLKVLPKVSRGGRTASTSKPSGANWKSFVHNNPHRVKRA